MSISTAIAALGPNLWWKLDEGGGSTANNSGSLANNGTVSGTVQWNIAGPEFETTAIRLFSGAQIVGAGMDVTALGSYTIGMWISMDASGPLSTIQPILSIGDVANRLARGIVIYDNHATVGTPLYGGVWNGGGLAAGGSPARNPTHWHWVVLTTASGTNGIKLYVDGVLTGTRTASGAIPALSTDPLLLMSSQPVALAHVCFWGGALGQVDIQSVSNEIAPWPHAEPINTPSGGGGGGGLTPEQAEQLGRIEANTEDIEALIAGQTAGWELLTDVAEQVDTIDQTLGDVNGKVDEALAHLNTLMAVTAEQILPNIEQIRDAVLRVFQTVQGAAFAVPISSIIQHPPKEFLSEHDVWFQISGQGYLQGQAGQWLGLYGLSYEATTVPAYAGKRDGITDEYKGRLVQFVVTYTDLQTSDELKQEVQDFDFHEYVWFWERPLPEKIWYDVTPGFVLTCRWVGAFQP